MAAGHDFQNDDRYDDGLWSGYSGGFRKGAGW